MQKIYWFTFLFGLLFASCESNSSSTAVKQAETTIGKKELKRKVSPRLLHVYLFDQLTASVVNQMLAELKKVYPSVCMEGRISLPDSVYFAPKKRYLAKKLLNTMMTLQANNDMVLGMTQKMIGWGDCHESISQHFDCSVPSLRNASTPMCTRKMLDA